MKTLSKLIVPAFMIVALFMTTTVKAQTTPADSLRFNIGIEPAEPLGNARIGTTFILGGTLRLQYGITNNLAITVTGGAWHFLPKFRPGTDTRYDSYGVIPLKAGLKEFFLPHIYIGAEAGVAMEATDSEFWGPRKLLLAPSLGYATKHWDFGINYDNFSGENNPYGLLGLRLAYGF